MPTSQKPNPEKAAKYAITASKGFSYYLPKSAQRILQEPLKRLPFTARWIYNEHYRELMCAKACAPESVVAMTKFVTSSFTKIARNQNAFACEMNEEIDTNEHERYEPVKFPVVAEPELDMKETATVANTGNKRKLSIKAAEDEQHVSSPYKHLHPHSRTSSSLSDVPSSAQLSDEDGPLDDPVVPSKTSQSQVLPQDNRYTSSVEADDAEQISIQGPTTPPVRSSDDDLSSMIDIRVAQSETPASDQIQEDSASAAMPLGDLATGKAGNLSTIANDL
ncbi:uncharacterized protein M421DRAFT_391653 [Didymella exigua CBS 183.55]|uniref:Uncharacterized protein n=1 Tax=Didymella exigua CBS 183.55 TaxID=1150837 RepID=A0A6A5RR15_9PLEO|nr:uncharacterized protein M421DRAFT_391653 [Didymella exigua CBS 183.55]KAF1928756.1 hypothetical protein M421DRAFT_391653 [Didymella exigua CBS 183.55]